MSVSIVVFKITGLKPLLQNNPASMARGGSGNLGTKKIPSPEEEAESKVYRLQSGQIYIPSISFRSSIIGAGGGASGRKIGKFTANSRIAAGLFTVEDKAPLIDAKGKPIKTYEIHTCRAVVQKQGVLRSRPLIMPWFCDLPLEIDEDFLTVDNVLQLLNISGKVAGVGDFRPQKKGMFGQYSAEIKA